MSNGKTTYVTVMLDPKGRCGWTVAARQGSMISHTRLEAATAERELAREQAQHMYPDKIVYVQGDKEKPWT